jgi:hypothetical protein
VQEIFFGVDADPERTGRLRLLGEEKLLWLTRKEMWRKDEKVL